MESIQDNESPATSRNQQTGSPSGSCVAIRNLTRDTQIATHIEVAGSNVKRSKGLLGRKSLAPGEGMWIIPCEAIHTFFMQFPIDLIYLDKKLRVKKVRSGVKAWRISGCLSAHSVLELPEGTIRDTKTERGDILEFHESANSSPAGDRNP